jgi:hypothetical protein
MSFFAKRLRRAGLPMLFTAALAAGVPAVASAGTNLSAAGSAQRSADRAVVSAARRVITCTHREAPVVARQCDVQRAKLQTAGLRLSATTVRLSRLARSTRAHTSSLTGRPTLTVSGQTLTWKRVGSASTYVVVRKISGRSDEYTMVTGTTVKPAPVPGKTATFSVRTVVDGSAWATERTITYPAAPVVSTKAAPTLTVDGQTLRWPRVAGVADYVLVRKLAGRADSYSVVHGTSATPVAAPGKSATYSVRTAVDGSAWATERTIAYPTTSKTDSGSGGDGSTSAPVVKSDAPVLTVDGQTLRWTAVSTTGDYVVSRKVAGQANAYTTVHGTQTTPVAVAGKTASYSVRADIAGSSWATERTITYPAGSATTTPAPAPATPSADRSSAPEVTIDGQTLRWAKVADVTDYVMVRKIAGQADVYSMVSGTSVTPPAADGATVGYSLRTDVDGSAWASDRTITYPAAAPAPSAPSSGTLEVGLVAGSALQWELPFIQTLGAKTARMEFDINTPASQMEAAVGAYAAAGVRPLLLATFNSRTPTASEAANLATWAAAFGPGGTFWAGKGYAANTVVTSIEFGNESNQSWQYPEISGDSNWAKTTFYANLATQYALRFKDAKAAIAAANPSMGLLAIADTPGNWPQWMNAVFAAVPNFGSLVSGWVVHPYGPSWQSNIDNALAQVASHGAPSTTPIYATEFGIASDNGRCLSDNYGWDKCMTYAQAGTALDQALKGMKAKYGSRLKDVYLYAAHDLQSSGNSNDREAYFGGQTLSGQPKGAYTDTVKSVLASGI